MASIREVVKEIIKRFGQNLEREDEASPEYAGHTQSILNQKMDRIRHQRRDVEALGEERKEKKRKRTEGERVRIGMLEKMRKEIGDEMKEMEEWRGGEVGKERNIAFSSKILK